MSDEPAFIKKNRHKFERVFNNFDEDVTYFRPLAGDDEEAIPLTAILSRRNPVTFETFGDHDIELKILNREKPTGLELQDEVRVEASGTRYAITAIRVQNVTTTLEATEVA